jgi:hypothetical protein
MEILPVEKQDVFAIVIVVNGSFVNFAHWPSLASFCREIRGFARGRVSYAGELGTNLVVRS